MTLGQPPRLVVFDVDGTLQDTFQWWPHVIRDGLTGFAQRHGFEPALPDDEQACSVVGLSDADVWSPFLPAEHAHRWAELRKHVVPMEVAVLQAGRDYLFPGVAELLTHLRRVGVKVALASNCRSAYFAAVCDGQGLGPLSDWQFCLDSRGGCDKTQMVRFALEEAATSPADAVMVGDRETDLAAARGAGVPFVWRVNDRCSLAAEGRWHGDPGELLGLLGLPRIS